ncbi:MULTISPECIES: Veg family protein [Staphylococcus]|uniref:Veg family protein n=2 Tax=Staphylococcus TaxID=1279 RepID=A0A1Z3U2F8_9STAP|nr:MULTISPECIES: Veg family protein [Staphylococcus]ASE37455.1 hypothetical protein CEP67_09205 [Staphylococcus pettenkoferi]EHM65389.1 hypothetical protein SEVCU012_2376 [Staphylococcus pettenkoferi VCU012]MBX8994476.1 hypothetical protein [Staphylococcus pettenkoferi]MCI2792390.1 Veg family protein [Staphylococcus pettenkoferi]MCI2804250.1 Veg family protein [Staphylococcus pettenkoferi]
MPKSIGDIKNSLDCHLGNRIVLKANGGRKKTIERSGVLKETYASVFIVELDPEKHNFGRVSYTYTDVLTDNVQVSFEEDNQQEAVAH